MATYCKSGLDLVESDLGSIRLRGRAGLTVSCGGHDYEVSSEMLMPPRSIVLYPRDADLRGLADADAIVAFIVEGLTWDGFTVELCQDRRVLPDVSDPDLSRAVSHALRHEPWLYELELDREGWVPVDQLLVALRGQGPGWHDVDRDDLARMIATAAKQRHELDGDRVRARYGHSVPGRIEAVAATPPARLFHGTAPGVVAAIRREGLHPRGRQYVHLSGDIETAQEVGRRKDPRPVLLVVDTGAAAEAGVVFHRGNDVVWLAAAVPPQHVQLLEPEPEPEPEPSGRSS